MANENLTARMYFDQGRQCFARQDFEGAADHFKLAIDQDPMFHDAHRFLAESFVKVGYKHRAKKAYEALLRITQDESQKQEIQQKLGKL